MSKYALFIASNPEPVSEVEWSGPEQVLDRARLSSGGTKVEVRQSTGGGDEASDFDREVATFVNGVHLETRDDGPHAISFLGDGRLLGTATLQADGEWHLVAAPDVPVPGDREVTHVPAAGHTRRDVERSLGGFVEDWIK